MKSILLFMIFVVCQLEGKKFSQDNFKVDYNYYLRKQDLHIIKTQNDLSNAWYLPPQKVPKEHSWVDFAKKYLNMMDYLGTYFLPFYHSFTPIFQWYHPNINPYQRNEFKFQISFRVPVFRHILWTKGTLYLAYTQTNWFQIYNNPQSAPMRMINFMPELIYVYPINFEPFGGKIGKFSEIWIGWQHISNGVGGAQCYQPFNKEGNPENQFPGQPVIVKDYNGQKDVRWGGVPFGERGATPCVSFGVGKGRLENHGRLLALCPL